MNHKRANDILSSVEHAYDDIASEFSDTRARVWGEFLPFKECIREGDSVLDVGCGNGRFLEWCNGKEVQYTGIDNSAKLLAKAQERALKSHQTQATFCLGSMHALPFKDEQFHVVLCIAALHHLPRHELRRKAVQEFFRVLMPGGVLLLSNWYIIGRIGMILSQIKQRIGNPSLYDGCGVWDFFIPWSLRTGETVYRYYYGFSKREAERLVRSTGFLIEQSFISRSEPDWSGKRQKRNLVLFARKPSTV